MQLSPQQKARLSELRKHVLANDHTPTADWVGVIENEVRHWSCVQALPQGAKFFEEFDLYDRQGRTTGVRTWRGICHWLWLRHGCVHGMLFTPTRMAIIQRRAASVGDSPGYLDMTFAGHMGTNDVLEAAKSEAKEEANVDISEGSAHVANTEDLEPIHHYDYIEPPRPNEEFYNAESRHVFAIRLTVAAMGVVRPLDREVGSFVLAPLDEAWSFFRAQDIASALRVSGPSALYHALRAWAWGT